LVPSSLPVAQSPAVDLRVLAFAAVISLATGLIFGIVPALQAGRGDLTALREGARSGGGHKERLRAAFVIAEVMASVVLLVSAGLLMRAMWRVQGTDPGFRPDHVLTLSTMMPTPKYDNTDRRAQFYNRVLAETRALPGVSSAAYITSLPMVWGGGIWPVSVAGEEVERTASHSVSLRFATPGFFATLRIPLLRGRDVSDSDTIDSPFAAVVSESFVKRYWPGQDPLGRHFNMAFSDRVVVGVVGDIRVRGLERPSEPQVYLPYKQVKDGWLFFYSP
jgi:hypothetical protein